MMYLGLAYILIRLLIAPGTREHSCAPDSTRKYIEGDHNSKVPSQHMVNITIPAFGVKVPLSNKSEQNVELAHALLITEVILYQERWNRVTKVESCIYQEQWNRVRVTKVEA